MLKKNQKNISPFDNNNNNKYCQDIVEILLKVVLKAINQPINYVLLTEFPYLKLVIPHFCLKSLSLDKSQLIIKMDLYIQ